MGNYKLKALIVAMAALPASALVLAEEAQKRLLDEVVIIEDAVNPTAMSGASYKVSDEDLGRFSYTDIHRILREVPGVYIQEEEGFGLRPNISIRGAVAERNSKLTMMEDGVLIAPAPYADPSAYYFPYSGRMSAVEVLKGPEVLRYGPHTVGGAVNLISTPVPASEQGQVDVESGTFGNQKTHVWYGGQDGQWGYLLEAYRHNNDGFHEIDRSSRDSGFAIQDYVAKLRWRSKPAATYAQQVDIKAQYSEETSNASYIGLTDADFNADPNRRYGLTELDQMNNRHSTFQIQHQIALTDEGMLTSSIYRTDFYRNWYKVDRIDGQSIGGFLYDANTDAARQDILDGIAAATLTIKNNARDYFGQGVQTQYSDAFYVGSVKHEWLVGARYHEDEISRYQPVDTFNQDSNGNLIYQSTGAVGAGDNRVGEAEAVSLWAQDRMIIDRWQITTLLRYEDIKTLETRYSDGQPRNVVSGTPASNKTDELMAGIGATYALTEEVTLLAGVHQGFTPAGAGGSTDPEESVNWELGTRYRKGDSSLDLIAFFSDYSNIVQNCTVAAPCTGGQTSGTAQIGEADIRGLELAYRDVLYRNGSWSVPTRLTWTWTDAEITDSAVVGSGDPDIAERGDGLPYLAEQMVSVTVGLDNGTGWATYANATLRDDVCITFGCDRVNDQLLVTEEFWTLDLATHYQLSPSTEVYAKVENLLDEQAVASRSPAGVRVNMPRYAGAGVKVKF